MSSITASYIAPSHPGCGMFFYATPVADSEKMMRKNSQVMDLRLAVANLIALLARPRGSCVQNLCGELFGAISRLGCGKSVTAQLQRTARMFASVFRSQQTITWRWSNLVARAAGYVR